MGWHEPRRTAALRIGRVSLAGARYFVTCAAVRPCERLVVGDCAGMIQAGMEQAERDGDMRLLCATTMPDHIHVIFELSGHLTVGQVIGKFKAFTRAALIGASACWQRGFFEHRLRPDDRTGDFARYVFLNPYRAGLIRRREVWPHWRLGLDVDFDFLHQLDAGGFSPRAWLEADLEALGLEGEDVGEGE